MVARPRKKGKKDLPLNLYEHNGYFKYLHPYDYMEFEERPSSMR